MKISDLKVGDRLEDYRRGVIMVITEIIVCGSCSCGWGEVCWDEPRGIPGFGSLLPYKNRKTFRQFERLKFIRREGDRV